MVSLCVRLRGSLCLLCGSVVLRVEKRSGRSFRTHPLIIQPKSDGLQPNRDGLEPKRDGLQPKSDGHSSAFDHPVK